MRMSAACVVVALWVGAASASAGEHRSIVEVARANGQFKTLVAALEAAGLAETLGGDGPFTVFAPTDAAFAALPPGAVDGLLRDLPALRRVLLHHVARGRVPAAEVVKYEAVRTLAETSLTIAVRGAEVRIGGSRVALADVEARNGIIHVIDAVLLPPAAEPAALLQVAEAAGAFKTLLAAVRAAGLEGALAGAGPFTVFAPTDAAFSVLPPGALEALLRDPERLKRLLLHHVIPGDLSAADLSGGASPRALETLAGTRLDVDARGGVAVGGGKVLTPDVRARNGRIHVVDRLLLPPPAEGPAHERRR